MPEVFVRYAANVRGDDGSHWMPQACGAVASDGLWEGWIEFVSGDRAVRTARETEQPSRDALMYWAQGLSAAYLEGALARATTPRTVVPREPRVAPRFEGPAPRAPRAVRPSRAILDPFATFAQGEDLLRSQLAALSHDNLVAIVEDYGLRVSALADMPARRLADAIVDAVRESRRRSPTSPAADPRADFSERESPEPGR